MGAGGVARHGQARPHCSKRGGARRCRRALMVRTAAPHGPRALWNDLRFTSADTESSMDTYRIAVVVGSLRQDSLNRKLALALAALGPKDFTFEHVVIGDLPLYNQDLEGQPGEAVKRLKTEIA